MDDSYGVPAVAAGLGDFETRTAVAFEPADLQTHGFVNRQMEACCWGQVLGVTPEAWLSSLDQE